MEAEKLYEKLKKYGNSDFYPFHMPGHKRNALLLGDYFPVKEDITEIDGFDNLHHPEEILLEAQKKAASLYGVKESFFSINGSTGALLSAISAAVPKKSRILMARNCHKAVYHAVYLRDLTPVYVYPQEHAKTGINGGITVKNVEKSLKEYKDIKGIVLTSPTYDGIVSDIRGIADLAHEYGIPLIVDEAHGAHFSFSDYFPESAVSLGADLVVHSVHKTLPSMTQTSLLHRCTDRVSSKKIRQFLDIYETSSPSYVLMASIDACMDLLLQRGEELFESYTGILENARCELQKNDGIRLLHPEVSEEDGIYDYDRSKMIFYTGDSPVTGMEFHDLLRKNYKIELEMDSLSYGLALSSVGDTKEGFERLILAVKEIDKSLEAVSAGKVTDSVVYYPQLLREMSISNAVDAGDELWELKHSVGRIAGEYIMLYPPGIPLVVPGEKISDELIHVIFSCIHHGKEVLGIHNMDEKYYLWTVKEDE